MKRNLKVIQISVLNIQDTRFMYALREDGAIFKIGGDMINWNQIIDVPDITDEQYNEWVNNSHYTKREDLE